MLREMQQPACGIETTSYEVDFAGNSRCFTEPTKDQKYGMCRFARSFNLSQSVSTDGLKISIISPIACKMLGLLLIILLIIYILVSVFNEVRKTYLKSPFLVKNP